MQTQRSDSSVKWIEREGFMYLDVDHPVVAWNTYRGVLASANAVFSKNGPGSLSMLLAGIFDTGNYQRLHSEFCIESIRSRLFPNAVSRLSGMFVFDDVESTLAATQATWGGHINTDCLTDVGLSYTVGTRADAGWITQMLTEDYVLVPSWEEMAARYWSGEPSSSTPIWELIIDGYACVWGTRMREQAFNVIRSRHPFSLGYLEESKIAAGLGFSVGHISSWLLRTDAGASLQFLIDDTMADDPRYVDAIARFIETARPEEVNPAAVRTPPGLVRKPDLQPYEKHLPLVMSAYPTTKLQVSPACDV